MCYTEIKKGVRHIMELRVLRYFLTVARLESITKAAEELHITQPTLSRQLAQMEDEYQVKLFERGLRKISLTNDGILLRRRAEEILQLVNKTEKELSSRELLIDGEILIGCGELASMNTVTELIKTFNEKHPLVRFDIHTGNADSIRKNIESGITDIGLMLEPVDINKFDFVRLKQTEKWVVLMRNDSHLAEKETIAPIDLKDLPLCLVRRPSIKNELASWFGNIYDDLNVHFTSNLTTNAATLVRAGMTYAMVLEGLLPNMYMKDICYRPLSPSLTATSVLAWKRNNPQNLAVSKFIEHIRNTIL